MSNAEGYQAPSELAERIRDVVRKAHEPCPQQGCALSVIWASDVQEILDIRDQLLGEATQ
jgi:hypothetical protein